MPKLRSKQRVTKPKTKTGGGRQLELDLMTPDGRAYLRSALAAQRSTESTWRGMSAVPPGSLVEHIITEFTEKTNIPLEIPFWTFMHYVSGFLVSREVKISVAGKLIEADIWSIILADSGAGKTWTSNAIGRPIENPGAIDITGAAGAAAWLAALSKAGGRGLWQRDEFFQFLRLLDDDGPMSEVKDYLLRIYDNGRIERSTKKDSVVVENPAISILGFTATDPFVNGMSVDSLVDGFAQRFSYILAKTDLNRHFRDYPIWSVDDSSWRGDWADLVADVLPEYVASDRALATFERTYRGSVKAEVPESFYRRILWRAHKYALVYHIVRGAASDPVVTDEDYGWAARAITLHLSDAGEVIDMTAGGQLGKIVAAAEATILKMKGRGMPITARNLIQQCSAIKSAGEARFCFETLGIEEHQKNGKGSGKQKLSDDQISAANANAAALFNDVTDEVAPKPKVDIKRRMPR